MREILFRGKRIDDGEWLYGYLITSLDLSNNPRHNYIVENISKIDIVNGRVRQDYYEIETNTLGQYTGLKDKNGKKIFEGDIVRIGSQIGYIVYNYGSFGIGLSGGIDYKKLEKKTVSWFGIENDNFLPLLEVYWNFNDEDEILSEVKVIGNIYDNPELLKPEGVS